MRQSVSIERLQEIADEVMNLIGADDIFELLDSEICNNMSAVDARLQEVMMGRQNFECMELAMYLRVTYSRQERLPSWQPLLVSAVELIHQRGEDLAVLYGVLPANQVTNRNTGQPVYKPHQT